MQVKEARLGSRGMGGPFAHLEVCATMGACSRTWRCAPQWGRDTTLTGERKWMRIQGV